MLRRFPRSRLKSIGVSILGLIIAFGAFVCANHYMQWLMSATVSKVFIGTLLLLIFVPLLVIGVIYKEMVFLRRNYADYYEQKWAFCWGMTTHAVFIAMAVCFFVDAVTGINPMSWFRSLMN